MTVSKALLQLLSLVLATLSTAESSSKSSRPFALLLDNLWFWALLIFGLVAIYGIWALVEIINMHTVPGVKPYPA